MLYRIKQIPHNLIFFLFGIFYLRFVVEPRLLYHGFGTVLPNAPGFLTGWTFLVKSLNMPGGFVMYVSGFLSQSFYYDWLGAAIIVLCALFVCELSRRHLMAAGYARNTVLASIPAVLLFLIYSQYKHPLPACLAVCLGLLCSLVFEKLRLPKFVARAVVYCLIASVVFWLAGTGGLLVFSLMTVIYGIFVRKDWGLAILALPAGYAVVWIFAQYVFVIPPRSAFLILTPVSPAVTAGIKTFSRILLIVLYGFVPLSVLLMFTAKKAFDGVGRKRKRHSGPAKRKETHTASGWKKLALAVFRKLALIAVPFVLTAVGFYFSYNRMSKTFLLANDYVIEKQWDKALKLGRGLPKGISNVYFNHDIIRALYHTGRLPYDLFQFTQTPHAIFLTHEREPSSMTRLELCDVFIELGQVNMAERMASEILAIKDHSAIVLEKMAWINIIKGQNQNARIYLNALKKDLIYRSTAEKLLAALDNGFTPEQTAYINRIRSCMPKKTYAEISEGAIDMMLIELLICNPENQMAFEYLMACYLLTGGVEKINAIIERFPALTKKTIPTLYEEAILIYHGSRGQKIDLKKYNIKRDT
ncbi:MAG: DUF6057 family protein, partial [Phycisphaerales bacterium]